MYISKHFSIFIFFLAFFVLLLSTFYFSVYTKLPAATDFDRVNEEMAARIGGIITDLKLR